MGFADFVATATSSAEANIRNELCILNLNTTFTIHIRRALVEKKKICNFLLPPNRPSQLFYNVIDLLLHYQMHGYIKAQLQVAVGYQKFKFSHFYT